MKNELNEPVETGPMKNERCSPSYPSLWLVLLAMLVLQCPAISQCLPSGRPISWGSIAISYVSSEMTYTNVVAGYNNSSLNGYDGSLQAWGDNILSGQLPFPSSAIAPGTTVAFGNSCMLTLFNGAIHPWGSTNCPEVTLPVALAITTNIVAISSGADHGLALDDSGNVTAWGDNDLGQTNVPSGLSGVAAISAGAKHSLALLGDGTVVAWGDKRSSEPRMYQTVMA